MLLCPICIPLVTLKCPHRRRREDHSFLLLSLFPSISFLLCLSLYRIQLQSTLFFFLFFWALIAYCLTVKFLFSVRFDFLKECSKIYFKSKAVTINYFTIFLQKKYCSYTLLLCRLNCKVHYKIWDCLDFMF